MFNTVNQRLALIKLAALAAILAISGCASTGGSSVQASAPSATKTQAAKPASKPSAVVITPATGDQGTVVFFRESKFAGGAISFKVRENNVELGKLGSGNYFVVNLPVGAHAFEVHSEAKDVLNLEVEPGQIYYIQGSLSFGVMVGRPNLSPSDAATFDSMKAKLKDSAAPKLAKK